MESHGAATSGTPGLRGRVQATCLPRGRITRCALTSPILASKISPTQNQWDYLEVLFAALSRFGAPKAIVSDGGGIFYCRQAMDVYAALGIEKLRIEKRQAWQNYVETHFNIARKMADAKFAQARSWEEMLTIHRSFVNNYNVQRHWAHEKREDGCHSVTNPIPLPQYHWYASNSLWQRYASRSDYKRSASLRSATRSVDMSG
jgi:hypothetical protein